MLFRDIVLLASQQVAAGGSAPPSVASWPSLIGAEMMAEPSFDGSTGWDHSGGVTIAAGVCTFVGDATFERALYSTNPEAFISGAAYLLTIVPASIENGSLTPTVGVDGETGTPISATGSNQQTLTAGTFEDSGVTLRSSIGATFAAQLDTFSVRSVGLLGVEGDWTFTGDTSWNAGAIVFSGPASPGSTAELTGTAKTAFDAAVSNSTACSVTLTPDVNAPLDSTLTVEMKGGTGVNFVFDGSGAPVTHTVTSGTGSGFLLTAPFEISGKLVSVQITLA